MKVNRFDDVGVEANLVSLFRSGNLIPLFGTGFTMGCGADNGAVPDAASLSKSIVKLASENPRFSTTERQEILGIKSLKTAFSLLKNSSYIPTPKAKKYLQSVFSKVRLPYDGRKDILQLPWPHIFTFNIDDAIETNTKNFKKILPNRPTSLEYLETNKCIFKMHGDIDEFLQYEDASLIFTWEDYAGSIEKNKALLSYFQSIAQRSAFLIIGCSLDAEIDLLHVSNKTKFVNSIYIKKGPLEMEQRLVLESYGIGQVICFDDYAQIYRWINSALKNVSIEERIADLEIINEPTKKDDIINYIASGGPIVNVDDSGQVSARVPSFVSIRSVVQSIREALIDNDYVILRGKRFSGKTLTLLQLYRNLSQYTGYFFASQDSYDPGIKKLLAGVENALFIFDASFFDGESLKELLSTILASGSKVILCCNNSDFSFIQSRFVDKSVSFAEFELKSSLNKTENNETNAVLNKAGLPVFSSSETLLSAAYRYYETYDSITKKSALFKKNVDRSTFEIIFVIAALGKLSRIVKDAAFRSFDINHFVNSYGALFEIEKSGTMHEVVVCNSSLWLMDSTRKFIDSHRASAATYIASIIVSLFESGAKSAANTLLRFDTLNEVVSAKGDAVFIRKVYEALNDFCESIPHYWLQLAKLELITGKNAEDIQSGIRSAKKIRMDLGGRRDSTYFSATLTLAQLCGREYILTKNVNSLVEMLKFYEESFENYENNKTYLDDIRAKYKKRDHVFQSLDALFKCSDAPLLPFKNSVDSLRHRISS